MASPVPPQAPAQPGQGRVIPRQPGSSSPTTPATPPSQGQSTEGGQAPAAGASVTPPTAPAQPSREQQLIASQEALLREQAQELARLRQSQRGLETRIATVEAGPAPTREQLNERFWRDPMSIVDTIREELRNTVKPINEYVTGQRTETEYDRIKNRLKAEYGDMWPHIENEVDRFVEAAAAAGNAVNDQLVGVAALAATGAYHRGLLGNGAPPAVPQGQPAAPATPPAAPPTQPSQSRDMLPPHLRPSAPAAPVGQQPVRERRQLTENEARLARERGMSHEQFLDWLEVPPDQVVTSQIGRPART